MSMDRKMKCVKSPPFLQKIFPCVVLRWWRHNKVSHRCSSRLRSGQVFIMFYKSFIRIFSSTRHPSVHHAAGLQLPINLLFVSDCTICCLGHECCPLYFWRFLFKFSQTAPLKHDFNNECSLEHESLILHRISRHSSANSNGVDGEKTWMSTSAWINHRESLTYVRMWKNNN